MISNGRTSPQSIISGSISSSVSEGSNYALIPTILSPIGNKGISLIVTGVASVNITNAAFFAILFPVSNGVIYNQYETNATNGITVLSGQAFAMNFTFLETLKTFDYVPTLLTPNSDETETNSNTGVTNTFRYNPNTPPAAGQLESNAFNSTGAATKIKPTQTIDYGQVLTEPAFTAPDKFPTLEAESMGLKKSVFSVAANAYEIYIPDKFILMFDSTLLNSYTGVFNYNVTSY